MANEGFFKITSVCKDDLRELFAQDKKALKKINKLTRSDMRSLAERMADDYCSQLFHESLKTIFEDRFMKED